MSRVPLVGMHELEVEPANDGRVKLRVHFDPKVMKSMGLSPLTSMGMQLTAEEAELVAAMLLEAAGWNVTGTMVAERSERSILTRRDE